MINKILCIVVIILSFILIGVVSSKEKANFSFGEEVIEKEEQKEEVINKIKVYNPDTTEIMELNLEDYIIGVVAAEMPTSFETEALKAQAVAARTFAIYKQTHKQTEYDVVKGISDQAYNTIEEMKKKWKENFEVNYEKIKNAVESTKGEILTYQGFVIESFYFSMSNGYTENCELVFKEELPYIKSVESSWDNKSLNNYEVTTTFTKEEFCNALEISCDNIFIENIERTASNRINNITINNKEFTGVQVRTLLKLRSTDFTIDVMDQISITTKGSGHGVGMSQYGANGMAKEGYSYQEILNHFYQNVEISKI